MKIILLGTGTPLVEPNPFRACTSEVIIIRKDNLLFDCGFWVSCRLLCSEVKPWDVNYLFFTHYFHGDHQADYPTFLTWRRRSNPHFKQRPIKIYGPPGTKAFSDHIIREIKQPSIDEGVIVNDVGEGTICETEAWKVSAIHTLHTGPRGEQSLAYRIDSDEGAVVISGDVCDVSQPKADVQDSYVVEKSLLRLARGAEVFIMDSDTVHVSPEGVGIGAQEAGVKKVIITHIHNPEYMHQIGYKEMRKKISKYFDGEIIIGKDLMTIQI